VTQSVVGVGAVGQLGELIGSGGGWKGALTKVVGNVL
jgi:hypothetical protein